MSKHYHFIGIGGIGMGTLATLLLDKKQNVSGSDIKENQMIHSLRQKGAAVFIGHDARNVKDVDFIIYSSAIDPRNPELIEAKQKNIPVIQRAKLLAELMEDHVKVTVGGAHGKTTTTSMVSHLLIDADLHPTTAIGGIVNATGTSSNLGKGEYFVAEVDESDGSFLYFSPNYSVITNIDYEHMDFYRDWNHILETYERFISQTAPSGKVIVCGGDENLMNLVRKSKKEYISYGFQKTDFVRAEHIEFSGFGSMFDVYVDNRLLGKFSLQVPGKHNVLNALAAVVVGNCLSINPEVIRRSLSTFKGVQRRFQRIGEVNGVLVIDDYGHHPTEITATLEAASRVKNKRLVVVFQPHRYSRLQALFDDFAKSLTIADYLIVTDIYAASEKPIAGLKAEHLIPVIQKITGTAKTAVYLPKENIVEHLLTQVRVGDLVVTLGAGDVTKLSYELVKGMENARTKFSNKTVQII
jgi:UDP-N-acetylmuramate--alanine ligase